MRTNPARSAVLAAAVVLATGCRLLPIDQAPAPSDFFNVRNDTAARAVASMNLGNGVVEYKLLPDEEQQLFTGKDCRGFDGAFRDPSGQVLAELEGPFCPGNIWVLDGRGKSHLEQIE